MTAFRCVLIALLGMLGMFPAAAHEIRPVSLELREVAPDRYAARWKVPAVEDRAIAIRPIFDARCKGWRDAMPRLGGASAVARFELVCPGGITGTRIVFDNLSRTMIDGMVTITLLSGQTIITRVRPTDPSIMVPAATDTFGVVRDYVTLGIEHILLGADHLLFVLALVLLVAGWRRLLITATAFTLAHSITLSLAALGVVRVPVPPIEALIALSILYLAVELVMRARDAERPHARVSLLAFAFGLLHGLGFASALAETGLPNNQIPLALLSFNIGVELGQIAFIALVLLIRAGLRSISLPLDRAACLAMAYATGGMASFWVIERVATF